MAGGCCPPPPLTGLAFPQHAVWDGSSPTAGTPVSPNPARPRALRGPHRGAHGPGEDSTPDTRSLIPRRETAQSEGPPRQENGCSSRSVVTKCIPSGPSHKLSCQGPRGGRQPPQSPDPEVSRAHTRGRHTCQPRTLHMGRCGKAAESPFTAGSAVTKPLYELDFSLRVGRRDWRSCVGQKHPAKCPVRGWPWARGLRWAPRYVSVQKHTISRGRRKEGAPRTAQRRGTRTQRWSFI